jgi:hypothetical protein
MMGKLLISLLALIALSSSANQVDEWKVTIAETYKNAQTINHEDSELGITCKNVCFYYVNPSVNCKKDSEDLTLLLTSVGNTLVVKNKCVQHESAFFYILDSYDEITELLKTDGRVFLVNDLIQKPKSRVVTHSVSGFNSILEKYFKNP